MPNTQLPYSLPIATQLAHCHTARQLPHSSPAVYSLPTVTTACPLPHSSPAVYSLPTVCSSLTATQLANGVQIANCHSLPAATELANGTKACQLPHRSLTAYSLPTATQLANSHFPFLPPNSFLPLADHISLVVIRRGNPPISRQSRPQVAGAISEW